MRLLSVSIEGYRRLAEKTNVRLTEPVIALVGPNEAGKSSFLDALRALNHDEPWGDRDPTRRAGLQLRVSLHFALESKDRDALKEITGARSVTRCRISKVASGRLEVDLDPPMTHDLEPRRALAKQWKEIKSGLRVTGSPGERKETKTLLATLREALSSEDEFLGSSRIDALRRISERIEEAHAESVGSDSEEARRMLEGARDLKALAEHEETCPPVHAKQELLRRRPKMLFFSDEERALRESYELSTEADKPSPALTNLARLAQLDLPELLSAAKSRNVPHVSELMEAANRRLAMAFSPWPGRDVVPFLSCEGTTLSLLVRSADGTKSWIEERSDGLRWFVALLAFMATEGGDFSQTVVLLIDEAESHLSYDAQANLVEVLESQTVVHRVIYTTHSAGCLPSDLGTGVRPVVPGEGERSEIRNAFWTKEPGFSPLLLMMGLGPLAFTTARNQVVAEGPSECLLLPSLIREATGEERLPYQVAPGASTVSADGLPDLLTEAGRVAFVLDGDGSGESRRESLLALGVTSNRIVTYRDLTGESVVLEDLLDPEAYVAALNEEIADFQKSGQRFEVDQLPEVGRVRVVEEWCREHGLNPVTKPTLCQRLAEKGRNGNIVAARHQETLKKLNELLTAVFRVK